MNPSQPPSSTPPPSAPSSPPPSSTPPPSAPSSPPPSSTSSRRRSRVVKMDLIKKSPNPHGSTAATRVVKKRRWTPQEDMLLIELVKRYGVHNWAQIADKMVGKKGKQCRDRWINNLRPDLKHPDVPWSEEEEIMLIEGHKKLGPKWSLIAKMIHGRSENAIKNHWNTGVTKQKRKMNSSTCDDPESSKRKVKRHKLSKPHDPESSKGKLKRPKLSKPHDPESSDSKLKRPKLSKLHDRVPGVPDLILTRPTSPSPFISRFVGYDIDYVRNQLMTSIATSILEEPTSRGGFDAQELPDDFFEGLNIDKISEEPTRREGGFDAQELPEDFFDGLNF